MKNQQYVIFAPFVDSENVQKDRDDFWTGKTFQKNNWVFPKLNKLEKAKVYSSLKRGKQGFNAFLNRKYYTVYNVCLVDYSTLKVVEKRNLAQEALKEMDYKE